MSVPYKYVLLKSLLGDDSYLDVKGASKHPSTQVITWSRNANANQVWYYDAANQAFRSKLNDFCLEYQPGKNDLVLNPFNPHNSYQKWLIHMPHIKLLPDPRLCVAIINDNASKGADVSALPETNSAGQSWTFEDAGGYATAPPNYNPSASTFGGGSTFGGASVAVPQPTKFEKREFLISSTMPGDQVLDIKGDNDKEGAHAIVYTTNRKKNQMWYVGQDGYIRSALNDMVFHADKKGDSLRMTPYKGNPKHQWKLQGNKIVNGEGHCLDIRGGKGRKGDDVCAYDYKGDSNQHWSVVY